MEFPLSINIAPLSDAPAPTVEPPAVQSDGLDALARCHVEFSEAGKTALALISLRKRLAAKSHGHLTAKDRQNLARNCKRLGFNEVWTNFIMGDEQ